MITWLAEYLLGELCVQYRINREDQQIGLKRLPHGMQGEVRDKQQALNPLVQLMIRDDGFANGHTVRNNASVQRFRYREQTVQQGARETRILTTVCAADCSSGRIS